MRFFRACTLAGPLLLGTLGCAAAGTGAGTPTTYTALGLRATVAVPDLRNACEIKGRQLGKLANGLERFVHGVNQMLEPGRIGALTDDQTVELHGDLPEYKRAVADGKQLTENTALCPAFNKSAESDAIAALKSALVDASRTLEGLAYLAALSDAQREIQAWRARRDAAFNQAKAAACTKDDARIYFAEEDAQAKRTFHHCSGYISTQSPGSSLSSTAPSAQSAAHTAAAAKFTRSRIDKSPRLPKRSDYGTTQSNHDEPQ